jgi:hypothetical protein
VSTDVRPQELYGPDQATRSAGWGYDAQGILLGRYDRCHSWDLLADTEVSRVHALVIQLRDRLVAIDTASTNGTFAGNQRVRLVEPRDGMPLGLGVSGRVWVRWCPR